LTLAGPASARAEEVRDGVNWTNFLSRHDLVWSSLPKEWHDGAFIGNGLLGSMGYSEGTNVVQWDVGRSDGTHRGSRIIIWGFAPVPAGSRKEGTMRLDLWNAEARGELVSSGSEKDAYKVNWRSFTHADKPFTVIELVETGSASPAKVVFQHAPAMPAREE